MRLTGEQFKELQQALLGAFPTTASLQQFSRTELDLSLTAITGDTTLSNAAFRLIEWMESQGRVEELIEKATSAIPGNSELRAFAEQFAMRARATGSTPTQQLPPNNLPRLQYFFGREAELKRIAETLAEDARGWGALIDGPGGIGKTSLAIRAAEFVSPGRFRRIIFLSSKERELTADGQRPLGAFVLPGYLEMLNAIARELGKPALAKSPEEERSNAILQALRGTDILLILDNLETLPEGDRDRLFTFLNRLPRGCSALVTSRRRADASAVAIRLDRLEWPASRDLIDQIAKDNPRLQQANATQRRSLYEETGGNPLLIRWITGQLGLGRCRTITDALTFLRSAPPKNSPLEFIFGDLLGNFTPNETRILAALTYFTVPMEVQFLAELAELNMAAAQGALSDLSQRALVLPDQEERRFILVPMVADFLRRARPEVVTEIGVRLEKRSYALIVENGNRQYDRFPILDTAWPILSPTLPLFLTGPNPRLQTMCNALTLFFEYTGRWDEWLSLEQKAESRALAEGDYKGAFWRALGIVGHARLRQNGDAAQAATERAATYCEHFPSDVRIHALVEQQRAMSQYVKQNYPAALIAFHESLALYKSISTESVDVVITLQWIAVTKLMSGDLEGAEQDYRQALAIAYNKQFTEHIPSCIGNLAEIALRRRSWKEAEVQAREALAVSENIGRQELVASNSYRIGIALKQQGKQTEALPYVRRALDIYIRLGSPLLKNAQILLEDLKS